MGKTIGQYISDTQFRLLNILEDIIKYCPPHIQKYNKVRMQRIYIDVQTLAAEYANYKKTVEDREREERLQPLVVKCKEPDAIHNEREQAYMKGYEDASIKFRTEKTEAYKQGWRDSIDMALNEAYTIHHYGDIFRVVQEETLIGLGMMQEDQNATRNENK